jgi:hypothetical protein
MGEPGERVHSGPGVRVRIKPDATLRADATPLTGEEGAAEQVGSDGDAVVAPLVALGPDAGQCGLVGEQGKLKWLAIGVRVGRIHREVYQPRAIRGGSAQEMGGCRVVSGG